MTEQTTIYESEATPTPSGSVVAYELFDDGVDIEQRDSGVWIRKFEGAPDLGLKVLGASSPAVQDLSRKLDDQFDEQHTAVEATTQETLEYRRSRNKQLAKVALLDWENVRIKGVDAPFDSAVAAQFIDDPRFEKFAAKVFEAMNRADEIRLKWKEDAEKN